MSKAIADPHQKKATAKKIPITKIFLYICFLLSEIKHMIELQLLKGTVPQTTMIRASSLTIEVKNEVTGEIRAYLQMVSEGRFREGLNV